MNRPPPSDLIVRELVPFLGPNTARTAVASFSQRALGLEPAALDAAGALRLVDALRPMMRTLLGATAAESVARTLREALR